MKRISKNVNPEKTIIEFHEDQSSMLAFALKSISECVSITDLDDRVIFVNEAFLKTYGYSREELLNKQINMVRSQNNSPDVVREILPASKRGGWHGELMNRRKDGSEFPVSLATSIIFNDNGQAVGIMGIASDITERKKVEEALRESEDLLRESQIIAGLGSYVLEVSSRKWKSSTVLDNIFGIDEKYDRSVEGWEALVHPDHRKEMSTYFSEEVLKKQTRFDKEYKIIRNNDKTERWVHGLGKLEVNDQGQVIKMYGTIQDITGQKQIQDEINKLNNELENRVSERTAQLEEANRELEAFSYSVSHDLRAPLRAIHGFTHILIEDYHSKLDEEGKRVCAIIQENAMQMGQLVDNLLKFSQLNRVGIQFSLIDMKNLGDTVYTELTTPEQRQNIDFQIEPLHPAWGDQTLIRQVWTNLISNALKFSTQRPNVKIDISSYEQKNYIVYCIQDNGAGFDMKYMDKLFGVFQRLHSVREFEGNGVGLAIVQRIIHRHGGKVWAEGEINKGASFYFSLPARIKENKKYREE
jgi:PAS domain S-box-containing protein